MGLTLKAILYAVVVLIGTLCNLITGTGHLTPATAAVIITGGVFAGAILIIDLKFSHSRVAFLLDSPTGKALEQLIEGKVTTAVAAGLQAISPALQSIAPALAAPVAAGPPRSGSDRLIDTIQ